MTARTVARRTTAAKRLAASVGLGVVAAGAVAAAGGEWQAIVLGGWAVAATSYCVWAALAVHRLSPEDTARLAVAEDDTRHITGLIVVTAALASLGGVAFGLHRATALRGPAEFALTALCVYVVAASWVVVHTSFMLRYAHEFHAEAKVGTPDAIGFPEPPDYADFAYLAFTIGMTFQVSDTDIRSRRVRRTLLRHALLSYVFGAVIIGVTINVIAGIV